MEEEDENVSRTTRRISTMNRTNLPTSYTATNNINNHFSFPFILPSSSSASSSHSIPPRSGSSSSSRLTSQLADVQRRVSLMRSRNLSRTERDRERENHVLERNAQGRAEGEGGGESVEEREAISLDEDLRTEAFNYMLEEAQRALRETGRSRVIRDDWEDLMSDDDNDDEEDGMEDEDQDMVEPESFYETYLPGLLGTRPLNRSLSTSNSNARFNALRRRRLSRIVSPTPTPPSIQQTPHASPPLVPSTLPISSSSSSSKLPRIVLDFFEDKAQNDQHTSSAPTSYLQTGVVFTGKQYYISTTKKILHPRTEEEEEEKEEEGEEADLNLDELPRASRFTSLFVPRTQSQSQSQSQSQPGEPHPRPRLALSLALESTSRLPLSLSESASTTRNNDNNTTTTTELSISEMEAQILAYRTESDLLRLQTRRFQEAHRITMDYLRNAMRSEGESEGEGEGEGEAERLNNLLDASGRTVIRDEMWEVKVFIESYNHFNQSLTGLMRATNIPSCPSSVVTYFVGKVLNPITKTLWYNWTQEDILFWQQLGRFKSCSKEEMWIRRKDFVWIEEMMKGFVFMYWQEKEFINLSATESRLSIQGRYIVALERSSGVIEGVYNDPNSSPTQRISLSVIQNESVSFPTFSYT